MAGVAGQGRQGSAWSGAAGSGAAGEERRGTVRYGRRSEEWQGRLGMARHGVAWWGEAWHGLSLPANRLCLHARQPTEDQALTPIRVVLHDIRDVLALFSGIAFEFA